MLFFIESHTEADNVRQNIAYIVGFSQHQPVTDQHCPKNHTECEASLSYSCDENPKERENERNFYSFDWFPPTLLYAMFDGDLTNTQKCIMWIKQVIIILSHLWGVKNIKTRILIFKYNL